MLSSTYLHAIKCIYYLLINFRTENQDVKFLLVLCSCLAPPAMFQAEAGQILSDRLCVQRPQSPVDSHPQSSWLLPGRIETYNFMISFVFILLWWTSYDIL